MAIKKESPSFAVLANDISINRKKCLRENSHVNIYTVACICKYTKTVPVFSSLPLLGFFKQVHILSVVYDHLIVASSRRYCTVNTFYVS